jgi:NitT/TauT family transport system substrate-binding protein
LQDIMDEAGELPKRIEHKTLVNTSFAKKAIDD